MMLNYKYRKNVFTSIKQFIKLMSMVTYFITKLSISKNNFNNINGWSSTCKDKRNQVIKQVRITKYTQYFIISSVNC